MIAVWGFCERRYALSPLRRVENARGYGANDTASIGSERDQSYCVAAVGGNRVETAQRYLERISAPVERIPIVVFRQAGIRKAGRVEEKGLALCVVVFRIGLEP